MFLRRMRKLLFCHPHTVSPETPKAAAQPRVEPPSVQTTSTLRFTPTSESQENASWPEPDDALYHTCTIAAARNHTLGGDPIEMTQPSRRRCSEDVADRHIRYLALAKHHQVVPFEYELPSLEGKDRADCHKVHSERTMTTVNAAGTCRSTMIPLPVRNPGGRANRFSTARRRHALLSKPKQRSEWKMSERLNSDQPTQHGSPDLSAMDVYDASDGVLDASNSLKVTNVGSGTPVIHGLSVDGKLTTEGPHLSTKLEVSTMVDITETSPIRPIMQRPKSSPDSQLQSAMKGSRLLRGTSDSVVGQSKPDSLTTSSGKYNLFPTVAFPNSSYLVKEFNDLPVGIRDQKKVKDFFGVLPERRPERLSRSCSTPSKPLISPPPPPCRNSSDTSSELAWPFNKPSYSSGTRPSLDQRFLTALGHRLGGSNVGSSVRFCEEADRQGDDKLKSAKGR